MLYKEQQHIVSINKRIVLAGGLAAIFLKCEEFDLSSGYSLDPARDTCVSKN